MKVHLAGLPVEVGPDRVLTPGERAALKGIEASPFLPGGSERVFRGTAEILLASDPPWIGPDGVAPSGEPAAVSCDGDRVCIGSQGFRAVLRPADGSAELFRETNHDRAIEAVLRVLLNCRLPMLGGLPLHAAGIAIDSVGAVFHGVSGAGKSTLSANAPFPVLSDEAVVTMPHDGIWEVSSSGFWGTLDRPVAPRGFFPLAGLFELHKEADTRIERLSTRQAFVSLLPVITIPDSPQLWSAAVRALGRLVETVPAFRLGWSPEHPPWDAIRQAIASATPSRVP